MAVTFIARLGVHSIVSARSLSNKTCETLNKLLFRIFLLLILQILISEFIFEKKHNIADVQKTSNLKECTHLPAKHKFYVSQSSVETLFRWGKKRLHHCMENLLRTILTKSYQNFIRFCKRSDKNILVCFFGLQFTWLVQKLDLNQINLQSRNRFKTYEKKTL